MCKHHQDGKPGGSRCSFFTQTTDLAATQGSVPFMWHPETVWEIFIY